MPSIQFALHNLYNLAPLDLDDRIDVTAQTEVAPRAYHETSIGETGHRIPEDCIMGQEPLSSLMSVSLNWSLETCVVAQPIVSAGSATA